MSQRGASGSTPSAIYPVFWRFAPLGSTDLQGTSITPATISAISGIFHGMPADFDPAAYPLPTSKAAAMSYLLLLVSRGYQSWHRGEVRHEKAIGFVAKMHALYPELKLKEIARMRAKAKGRANLQLVLFPDLLRPVCLQWWLLATPGVGLVYEREKMKSIFEHPLLWLDQYQIERVTSVYKPSGAKKQQRRTWSWVMQPAYRQQLRDTIKSYADAQPEAAKVALRALFERLRRAPMFAGIRDDLQALDRYARDTWNTKHRKTPYVSHVQSLPYMTRIPVFGGLTLGAVVEAMQADAEQAKAHAQELARRVLSGEDAPVQMTQSLRSRHGPVEEVDEQQRDLFGDDTG